MVINKNSNKFNIKKVLLPLLFVPFFICAFTLSKSSKERLPQQKMVLDSVITDLSKIEWDEVRSLSAKDGELSGNLKNGDIIIISRKAYLKYAKENNKIYTDYDKMFTVMEIYPEYPGGERAWLKYLNNNLNYPDKALNKNIDHRVIIQFNVDVEGNISNIKPLYTDSDDFVKEAMKTVKESGKWNPAIQNFRIVNALVTKLIVFKGVHEG